MLEVMTQATRIAHLDHPFGDWPLRLHRRAGVGHGRPRPAVNAEGRAGRPRPAVGPHLAEMLSRTQADRIVLRGGQPIDTSLPDYRELDDLFR